VHSVAGARIRFAGRSARTNTSGRAKIAVELRAGRHIARARKRGLKDGSAVVRVR
jgi:hypothetical protein